MKSLNSTVRSQTSKINRASTNIPNFWKIMFRKVIINQLFETQNTFFHRTLLAHGHIPRGSQRGLCNELESESWWHFLQGDIAFQVQLQNVAQSDSTPATASWNRVHTLWSQHSLGTLNKWTNTSHGSWWESLPTSSFRCINPSQGIYKAGSVYGFCFSPNVLISVNVSLSGNESNKRVHVMGLKKKTFCWSITFIQKV